MFLVSKLVAVAHTWADVIPSVYLQRRRQQRGRLLASHEARR